MQVNTIIQVSAPNIYGINAGRYTLNMIEGDRHRFTANDNIFHSFIYDESLDEALSSGLFTVVEEPATEAPTGHGLRIRLLTNELGIQGTYTLVDLIRGQAVFLRDDKRSILSYELSELEHEPSVEFI